MVTMNQGIKEVRDVGSRFIHRMETGMLAAFDWVTGPAMSEQDRLHRLINETEPYRRYPQSLG